MLSQKSSKNNINNELLNNYKKILLFNDLINLIKNKNSIEAISFLDNNKEYISFCQLTVEGFTALMCACMYQLEDIALAIIKTGYSKPGHVSNSSCTALIYAINNNLEKVAYELVMHSESNLCHIDTFGNNALIHACQTNNENIALFIIKNNNEKCNLQQKNFLGKNALMYAVKNKLNLVSHELNKIYYPPWIKVPL